MSADKFFPQRPDSHPVIYAYEDTNPQYQGLLKIGYTTVDVQKRVEEQYPTKRPGNLPYKIVFEESAMRKVKKWEVKIYGITTRQNDDRR